MASSNRVAVRLQAVQSYLEIEFPGQVDGIIENSIVVSHNGIRHYVVLQPTFLNLCPNYMQAIRDSELVESMHEFVHKRDAFSSRGISTRLGFAGHPCLKWDQDVTLNCNKRLMMSLKAIKTVLWSAIGGAFVWWIVLGFGFGWMSPAQLNNKLETGPRQPF